MTTYPMLTHETFHLGSIEVIHKLCHVGHILDDKWCFVGSFTVLRIRNKYKLLSCIDQRCQHITGQHYHHSALYKKPIIMTLRCLRSSGGFTPCRHLRPSSGREHTVV